MARDDNTRFRITTWPREPVPFPAPHALAGEVFYSSVWPVWEDPQGDDAQRIGYTEPEHPLGLEVEWTPEFEFGETYLELYAVDLSDPVAIFEFVERYGLLGVKSLAHGDEVCGYYMGFPGVPSWLPTTAVVSDAWGTNDFTAETEGEFIFGALCLRDMTTAWRVFRGEIELAQAEWVTPCWSNAIAPIKRKKRAPTKEWRFPEWEPKAVPEVVLELGLASGLRPFFPRLQFANADGDAVSPADVVHYEEVGFGSHGGTRAGVYGYDIPLYSVCCLELFNHIAEDAQYKLCANQTCGRLFVRQEGRATHGQHRRIGVKYCSSSCARAQAQRAYRQRKRAAHTAAS